MLISLESFRTRLSYRDRVRMEGGDGGAALAEPPTSIGDVRDRMSELHHLAQTIQNKADGEKRELTEDEVDELAQVTDEFDRLEADLLRRERIAAQADKLSRGNGRRTEPDAPAHTPQNRGEIPEDDDEPPARRPARVGSTVRERYQDRGKWGFKSFGEFATSVRMAGVQGGSIDNRLSARMQPGQYGSEGVGADGGFAVPPDFRQAIIEKVMAEGSLLSLTDQLTSSGNTFTFPKDETTPWQTSGGVQAYWESEASQLQASKPALEQTTLRLNKLTALVPVTEELLDDAPALDTYLRRKAPSKMNFRITHAILQGSGAGQPLGVLNSSAMISVAKVATQVADTLVGQNIIDMWSRLYTECRPNAVWLINQDIEPQLLTLMKQGKLDTGAADTGWGSLLQHVITYGPAGEMRIFNRPVIPTQACSTLGDQGDIVLMDPTQYMTVTKGGGVRTDVSIHLWFDYDITAFRFIFRLGGQPWWGGPIQPLHGSNTLSCFVTMDERG